MMTGKVQRREAEVKFVPASREALEMFSRDELRRYAESIGVDRGRSKQDTIDNLINSGKATLCATIGD